MRDPQQGVETLRAKIQAGERGGSDRDRAALMDFSDQLKLMRETYGWHRHEKLLRHCVRISELADALERHQPLTTEHVQRLIEEGFGVSYSQRHLSRLLKKLGMKYAIPRPESPDRPDDADEILEERLEAALEELDDDVVTDGGVVIGFLDEAWPRPTDNSRRLCAFEKPTLRKETPTPSFDDVVFGFYAPIGESVVACKDDLSKESVADFFPHDPPAEPKPADRDDLR